MLGIDGALASSSCTDSGARIPLCVWLTPQRPDSASFRTMSVRGFTHRLASRWWIRDRHMVSAPAAQVRRARL